VWLEDDGRLQGHALLRREGEGNVFVVVRREVKEEG
jgi:hypothetical protein